jgi:acetoin utilization deacetylase AcuC-like enzyme
VAYVLEGGYDINALTESIAQVIEVTNHADTGENDAQPQAIPAAQRDLLRAVDERFRR